MVKDKRDKLVLALIVVIVLLMAVLGYLFLIKPAISGFVVSNQNQGVQYAILSIAQQASTCKPVSLPIGNQTMDIIWVKCLQQSAAATPATTTTATK
jgi:hypothetical protein